VSVLIDWLIAICVHVIGLHQWSSGHIICQERWGSRQLFWDCLVWSQWSTSLPSHSHQELLLRVQLWTDGNTLTSALALSNLALILSRSTVTLVCPSAILHFVSISCGSQFFWNLFTTDTDDMMWYVCKKFKIASRWFKPNLWHAFNSQFLLVFVTWQIHDLLVCLLYRLTWGHS